MTLKFADARSDVQRYQRDLDDARSELARLRTSSEESTKVEKERKKEKKKKKKDSLLFFFIFYFFASKVTETVRVAQQELHTERQRTKELDTECKQVKITNNNNNNGCLTLK
jgi:hypothetical protein